MTPYPIWLAGVTSSTVSPNPTWKFALIRLNESTGAVVEEFNFRQAAYASINNGKSSFIKHFAYDSAGTLFFGTFEVIDLQNPGTSKHSGIWSVNKSTGAAVMRDFTAGSNYGNTNRITGMRPTLDGSKVHLIQVDESS
jgi:hypothetical protein